MYILYKQVQSGFSVKIIYDCVKIFSGSQNFFIGRLRMCRGIDYRCFLASDELLIMDFGRQYNLVADMNDTMIPVYCTKNQDVQ